MRFKFPFILLLLCFCACHHPNTSPEFEDFVSRQTQSKGFVYIENQHFMLDGDEWFPLMLNYKVDIRKINDSLYILPASYYQNDDLNTDFQQISAMGFNTIRICLDIIDEDEDSLQLYRATERMLDAAEASGLKVMLLIKRPLEEYWLSYTEGLLKRFQDNTTLWAYDFFNEPLYFDPVEGRGKNEAYHIVKHWRQMMDDFAPHQLFTIGFAEPIEVFEWDPSILPVDFVEIHTYNPMRVAAEMRWYSYICTQKPWMVGETGLPVDNDSVPYWEQIQFLQTTYLLARQYGAAGYGWWEYRDCPQGVNFEAQFTGLFDANGQAKPAAALISQLTSLSFPKDDHQVPTNYYNMLGYKNIRLTGKVVDAKSGHPLPHALVRGWTETWIGMNTYSDSLGNFTLYSNDYILHFEVSAPGKNTIKFDKSKDIYGISDVHNHKMTNKDLEYQSIDYHWLLNDDTDIFSFDKKEFEQSLLVIDIGEIRI